MRAVSLLASATERVSPIGCGDMLVGRSQKCDNPALPSSFLDHMCRARLCSSWQS